MKCSWNRYTIFRKHLKWKVVKVTELCKLYFLCSLCYGNEIDSEGVWLCVCVHVSERERETETEKERDKRDRQAFCVTNFSNNV
jgi:hypothetical protein